MGARRLRDAREKRRKTAVLGTSCGSRKPVLTLVNPCWRVSLTPRVRPSDGCSVAVDFSPGERAAELLGHAAIGFGRSVDVLRPATVDRLIREHVVDRATPLVAGVPRVGLLRVSASRKAVGLGRRPGGHHNGNRKQTRSAKDSHDARLLFLTIVTSNGCCSHLSVKHRRTDDAHINIRIRVRAGCRSKAVGCPLSVRPQAPPAPD